MISTHDDLQKLTGELGAATWTLAALGALYESGLADLLREPRTIDELASVCRSLTRGQIERVLDLLATRGVVVADGAQRRLALGMLPSAQGPMRAAVLGEIRSTLMQPLALLDAAGRDTASTGWRFTDRALLQAQGDSSSAFAAGFKARMVHQLGDLAARLDRPGARFLDVGVGVASLSIAMCRELPQLSVVGLDVGEAPLAIARENVERAGLAGRIELRRCPVEDLRDEASYDLAWLPSVFIAADRHAAAAERMRAALRPGGWLLVPALDPDVAPATLALWALIEETWGTVVFAPDAEAQLRAAGFEHVAVMPGVGALRMVSARR